MTILAKLLEEISASKNDLTEQVRYLCNKINEEEKISIEYKDLIPKGSRVFLSLETPGRYDWEIGFLTLERDDYETYIAVYHTLEKIRINEKEPIFPRRRKIWIINEGKAERILLKFVEKLKLLRGE